MALAARRAPPRALVAPRARARLARASVRASRAPAVDDDARFGRRRDALALGDVVEVRLVRRPGASAGDAATAVGEISDFVTNSSFHADGIKVRLKSGEIGRVTRARWDDEDDEDEVTNEATRTRTRTRTRVKRHRARRRRRTVVNARVRRFGRRTCPASQSRRRRRTSKRWLRDYRASRTCACPCEEGRTWGTCSSSARTAMACEA